MTIMDDVLQSGRHARLDHVPDSRQAGRVEHHHPTEAQGLLLHHAGRQPYTTAHSSRDYADSVRPQAGPEHDPQGQTDTGKRFIRLC